MLKESVLELILRDYLTQKGWKLMNEERGRGQHDWDIKAWHSKNRKRLLIECKGDSDRNNIQKIHNSFWVSIGQVMARMDRQGNDTKKARTYAIGIPKKWENTFRNKAKKWNMVGIF